MPRGFLFEHEGIEIHKTTVGGNPVIVATKQGKVVGTCSPPRGGKTDCVFGIPVMVKGEDAVAVRRALEAGVVFIKF